LLPSGPRLPAHDYSEDYDDIIEANVQIRRMIGTEGAILVDLYEAFNGRTARLGGRPSPERRRVPADGRGLLRRHQEELEN
jgi:hypothetical protein